MATDNIRSFLKTIAEVYNQVNDQQKQNHNDLWEKGTHVVDLEESTDIIQEFAPSPRRPSGLKMGARGGLVGLAAGYAASRPEVQDAIGQAASWSKEKAGQAGDWLKNKAEKLDSDLDTMNKKPSTPAAPTPATPAASTPSGGRTGSGVNKVMNRSTTAAPPKTDTPKQETPPAGSSASKMSFNQAYAKAREAAKAAGKDPNIAQFKFDRGGGEKVYQAAATKKDYVPMSKQFKVDIGSTAAEKPTPLPPKRPDDLGKVNAPLPPSRPSDLPKPAASGLSWPTIGTLSGEYNPDKKRSAALSFKAPDAEGIAKTKWVDRGDSAYKAEKPQAFDDNRLEPSVTSGNAEFPMSDKFVKTEPKKKVAEQMNPLVAAFLKLQETKSQNLFVEAKKLSKKQDEKLDVVDDDKIDAKDLAALRAGKKKVEEANIDPVVTGSSSVTKDPKKYVDPSTPKVPYSELPKPGNAAGDVLNKASDALNKKGVREESEGEALFSQAEIDHLNSFFEAVAPSVAEPTKGVNPTAKNTELTDETIVEGRPKKNPTPETTDRDPRQHIQVMAGRAAAGNVLDFKHENGKTSKLTPGMGRAITAHLNSLKPADRQKKVNAMHASPEGLKV